MKHIRLITERVGNSLMLGTGVGHLWALGGSKWLMNLLHLRLKCRDQWIPHARTLSRETPRHSHQSPLLLLSRLVASLASSRSPRLPSTVTDGGRCWCIWWMAKSTVPTYSTYVRWPKTKQGPPVASLSSPILPPL